MAKISILFHAVQFRTMTPDSRPPVLEKTLPACVAVSIAECEELQRRSGDLCSFDLEDDLQYALMRLNRIREVLSGTAKAADDRDASFSAYVVKGRESTEIPADLAGYIGQIEEAYDRFHRRSAGSA